MSECDCEICRDKFNSLYTRLNIMEDDLNHIKEVLKCELDDSDEEWEPVLEYPYGDDSLLDD